MAQQEQMTKSKYWQWGLMEGFQLQWRCYLDFRAFNWTQLKNGRYGMDVISKQSLYGYGSRNYKIFYNYFLILKPILRGTMDQSTFHQRFTLEQRMQFNNKLRQMYPNMVPLVIERDSRKGGFLNLQQNKLGKTWNEKYMLDSNTQVHQLVQFIRSKLSLNQTENLFIFLNQQKKNLTTDQNILNLYNTNKDEDGFLYLSYSSLETFGEPRDE